MVDAFRSSVAAESNRRNRAESDVPPGRSGQIGEQVAQLGQHLREIARARAQLSPEVVRVRRPQMAAQHLDPQPVGRRTGFLPAPTPEDLSPAVPSAGG